jgi:hypothetical protein
MCILSQKCGASRDIHCSVNTLTWQPSYVTAITDTYTTIEELLEAVFSVGSMQRLYKESQLGL